MTLVITIQKLIAAMAVHQKLATMTLVEFSLSQVGGVISPLEVVSAKTGDMLDGVAPWISTEHTVDDDLQCNSKPYLCLRQSSCSRQYVCRESGTRLFRPDMATVYAFQFAQFMVLIASLAFLLDACSTGRLLTTRLNSPPGTVGRSRFH